ncbi:DVU3141 family protein [Teichococcus oryzae]|nr:DVU3141 family protein [Pseudoroseomonas oryzae]
MVISLVMTLSGCAAQGGPGAGANPAVAAVPARPSDPLAAFAARAQPGQAEDVSPQPGAAPVTVRLVRAYHAGSGRECRELSVGYRAARPALYCEDPATGWAAARGLLRGGAVGRP